MPMIKLIKVHRNETNCYYCNTMIDTTMVADSMSPWQEVTDEELEFIRSWAARRAKDQIFGRNKKFEIVVIEDITYTQVFSDYVSDIKDFITKEEKKQKDAEKKRAEAEKKRIATMELKKLKKAEKLLKEKGHLLKGK